MQVQLVLQYVHDYLQCQIGTIGPCSGLQLPFAIVANLEKNIELATMALQLAKTF